MARKRDYAKEYARRQELARERGFTGGYQEERRYKERLKAELEEFGYPEPSAVLEPPPSEMAEVPYSHSEAHYYETGADRWLTEESTGNWRDAEKHQPDAEGSHWHWEERGFIDLAEANERARAIDHDPAGNVDGWDKGQIGHIEVLYDDLTDEFYINIDAYHEGS